MENTKLTLSIPKKLLVRAKAYSKKSHQPLSFLVSRYFALLSRSEAFEGADLVASRVKQVTGLAKSGRNEKDLLFEALTGKYR